MEGNFCKHNYSLLRHHRRPRSGRPTMSSSARIPFIPRPASRAAHLKDQQNPAKPKAPQQFFADVASPLHSSSNTQLSSVVSQQRSQTGANVQPPATVDKPLNTSGLLKKKKIQMAPLGAPQNPSLSRRPSFPGSDAIIRPGTADPHSNAHQNQTQTLKIAAPVPRQPARASSPTLSNSLAAGVFSFAPPTSKNCLPTPSQPQPIPESAQRPKDAHTPALGLGFNFSKTHTVTEQHQNPLQQLPSPPDTIRTSSTSVLESLPALEPDCQTSIQPFTLNMPLPNQTSVLLDHEGTHSSSNSLLDQSTDADDSRHGRVQGRRTINDQQLKRPRNELGYDEQNQDIADDNGGHPKRYKNHTVRVPLHRYTKTLS